MKKNLLPKLRLYPVRKSQILASIFSEGVYAVVDRNLLAKDIVTRRKITCIQLREKNAPSIFLIRKIKVMKNRLEDCGIPFIVNDRLDVALATDIDGVHLGNADMPIELVRRIIGKKIIIGKTVRNAKQASEAEKKHVDYISVGPIFKTPIKKESRPKGITALKRVKKTVNLPVIAIGGITFSNINKIKAVGADGVAMMRGVKNDIN